MKTTVLSLGILLFGAGSCGKWREQSLKKPAARVQASISQHAEKKHRLPLNFN